MKSPFFCISYFDGELTWVEELPKDQYILFNKSGRELSGHFQSVKIQNVGYNLYSYLTYIVQNFDDLPELLVFTKNNVFPRHVRKEIFYKLIKRDVFTPIEDPYTWERLAWPVSVVGSDGGYLELNNSWYTQNYQRRFFSTLNTCAEFIFEDCPRFDFVRFAPGANYIVPRRHVLLRSKNFYRNLCTFVSYAADSCESHFIERLLYSIWNSNLRESSLMQKPLSTNELERLMQVCYFDCRSENRVAKKIRSRVFNVGSKLLYTVGSG